MNCTVTHPIECPNPAEYELKWIGRNPRVRYCSVHFNNFVPSNRRRGQSDGARFEWKSLEASL